VEVRQRISLTRSSVSSSSTNFASTFHFLPQELSIYIQNLVEEEQVEFLF
jgi:hypothetical protein